jgi:hypothetical protein
MSSSTVRGSTWGELLYPALEGFPPKRPLLPEKLDRLYGGHAVHDALFGSTLPLR